MNLPADEVATRRIAAQLLGGSRGLSAVQVVAHLGGVQAQDLAAAKWSIGIRLPEAGEPQIDRALSSGQIIRTWAYRGTLHLLAAADAAWLLALLAPSVVAANQRRYRELELEEKTFTKSNRLITEILKSKNLPVTRSEICKLLERAGVRTEGQRAYFLLQRAGLEGLLSLGPKYGREATYNPLSAETGPFGMVEPDVARTALAERYFISHGPATIQDFSWWSGLPLSLVRKIFQNGLPLQSIIGGGEELWAGKDQTAVPSLSPESVLLLPPFDEYLLSYRNRSAALDPACVKKVNAGGGLLKPTVVMNGRVTGVWKPIRKKNKIMISVEPFREFSDGEQRLLASAVERYGGFRNTAAELLL